MLRAEIGAGEVPGQRFNGFERGGGDVEDGVVEEVDCLGNESFRKSFILQPERAEEQSARDVPQRSHATQSQIRTHENTGGGDHGMVQVARWPQLWNDSQEREFGETRPSFRLGIESTLGQASLKILVHECQFRVEVLCSGYRVCSDDSVKMRKEGCDEMKLRRSLRCDIKNVVHEHVCKTLTMYREQEDCGYFLSMNPLVA